MNKVAIMNLVAYNVDDLGDGFQPFLFCQYNPAEEEVALRSSQLYNAVNAQTMRPTLAEMKSLMQGTSKEGSRLPPSHMHGIKSIGCF